MRNEGLFDIEGFNEHLPGGIVDAEDCLVLLHVFFPLIRNAMRICRDYI